MRQKVALFTVWGKLVLWHWQRMQEQYKVGASALVRIPKRLITDPLFVDLSLSAKLLYGILLDRMSLSMKNKWLDNENRVYIIYQITEIKRCR